MHARSIVVEASRKTSAYDFSFVATERSHDDWNIKVPSTDHVLHETFELRKERSKGSAGAARNTGGATSRGENLLRSVSRSSIVGATV
jgi:hypothetical protein